MMMLSLAKVFRFGMSARYRSRVSARNKSVLPTVGAAPFGLRQTFGGEAIPEPTPEGTCATRAYCGTASRGAASSDMLVSSYG